MARSNLEIRRALDRGLQRRQMRWHMRRCLQAIDNCLTTLEELHVKGTAIYRRDGCRKVVAGLVAEAGEQPPEAVQLARTSYDLHSALLNWESSVLDAVVPRRRERFPDLNQERDEWPRPRRRRRRRRADSGSLVAA
ncbi:MAG: hypothetical protein ACREOD_08970 [Candidatus Dormibacteria bacterium]